MNAAVIRSAYGTDLTRYKRSMSLWLLLLSAPVAARYMISETEGEGINIAVGGQLPVLTSPVLGVWLGIVVSVLVMPVAFIYLRAGPTRRQPWQVEETTAASRVSIALGRFGADALVMAGMLTALSLAGLFLGWLKVSGPWQPVPILALAWLIAGPALLATAAIRILFDAVPWLRGALGDFLFFCLWMATIIVPSVLAELPSSYWANLPSLGGAIRPLMESAPPGSDAFAIGTSNLQPGRVTLDPWRGIAADGYILARLSWVLIAIGIAALAGVIYRPHKAKPRKDRLAWLTRLLPATILPHPPASPAPAKRSAVALPALIWTEMRLIAAGPLFLPLALVAAMIGLQDDYRHIGSPAALLLLVFALSAHAGRTEARGLVALTGTMPAQPMIRRMAFVMAGATWSLAIAVPAIALHGPGAIFLAAITGTLAALGAIALAWAAGSPFVARIVLLIAWYAYMAS